MNRATWRMVSTFGVLAGLVGIEHGLGAVLQGNTAPDSVVILSWPDSPFFDILAGEPAMTLIPNLLITGILAIVVSAIFAVWAALYVQRKNGGLILLLLSVIMLLVGGGFGPPLLGIVLGVTGTRIHAPLTWWRTRLAFGTRRFLSNLWPWAFGVCFIAWLALFPGISLFDYFVGVADPYIMNTLASVAFGSLLVTIFLGFARDADQQTDSAPLPTPRRAPTGHA